MSRRRERADTNRIGMRYFAKQTATLLSVVSA